MRAVAANCQERITLSELLAYRRVIVDRLLECDPMRELILQVCRVTGLYDDQGDSDNDVKNVG